MTKNTIESHNMADAEVLDGTGGMEEGKLYYQDPYKRKFQAVVQSCVPGAKTPYEVILSQTAFYPEGGGQPFDMGVLGTAHVLEVHEKGGNVVHYVDGPLAEGSIVEGTLDWPRRFSHMQQHSGEHLLSGLIHRSFGYDNVGFHMGQEEVTVDFNGPLNWEQAEALEQEANDMIYANIPIRISYPSPEELHNMDYRSKKELTGQIRIVEIPGGDVCACCGTHVRSTGEIGIIKIVSLMNYKGGVRLGILCGSKALKDYERKQKQVLKISGLLSAKPDSVAESVEKLKSDSALKDVQINQLYQKLLQIKASSRPDSPNPLLVLEDGLSPVLLRQYCTMLYEQGKGNIVLVCSKDQETWKYALGGAGQDMRPISKKLNGLLNGRGGGSSLMVQGTFQATEEILKKVWAEVMEGEEGGWS